MTDARVPNRECATLDRADNGLVGAIPLDIVATDLLSVAQASVEFHVVYP